MNLNFVNTYYSTVHEVSGCLTMKGNEGNDRNLSKGGILFLHAYSYVLYYSTVLYYDAHQMQTKQKA
jgi:hypothetical protein